MSSGRGPPDIKGMSSLKVDNLTYRTTSDDLRRVFEKYGEIGDIYIPRDRFSRESRGFAFVRYFDRRDAEDAMESMDGRRIDGRELRVQMARYGRPETPPYKRKRRRSRSRSRSRDRRRRRSYSRSRSRSRSRERRRRSRSASRSRSRSRSRSGSKSRSRSPGAGVEEERPSSKSPEVRDEENGLHQRSSPSAAADDNGRGSRSPGKDATDRGSASPDRRSKSASRSRSRSRSSD